MRQTSRRSTGSTAIDINNLLVPQSAEILSDAEIEAWVRPRHGHRLRPGDDRPRRRQLCRPRLARAGGDVGVRPPYLTIDLNKIEHNARTIVGLCARCGIAVTGVTKATCGTPDVARAMLRGGVSAIGESHIDNIARLRAAGLRTSYMLLQLPPLSGVADVVAVVDVSLTSELAVLAGLSDAARRRSRVHEVVLMVDLGDLREGIWPDDLVPFVRAALRLPGLRIKGLGTNSSGLELIASDRMPKAVNHARIGEGILLGREDVDVDGIVPVDAGMRVLGGSSDYLVVDVTDAPHRVRVGDTLAFSLKYGALLAAMISQYVEKCPVAAGVPVAASGPSGSEGRAAHRR